ncbi:MAG: polysaccharide deacetylase family protein [Gammaproteobacteria bacterium]|nr:polysaccharide deacetylase family protein [Gammaproteobacteria bacterium]
MSLADSLIRCAGSIASKMGGGAKLSILVYHRVLPDKDPFRPGDVDKYAFDDQMSVLSDIFNVLPLSKAIALMEEGNLPARAVSITFDDGYADNQEVALPILQRHGLSATFFLATGYLNGGIMWNDSIIEAMRLADKGELRISNGLNEKLYLDGPNSRLKAASLLLSKLKYLPREERNALVAHIVDVVGKDLPANLMMTDQQARSLFSGGMALGAHTVRHPILSNLSNSEAEEEVQNSRIAVEKIAGEPVELFAYPNGRPGVDYSRRDVGIVREAGFKAALTTAWGVSRLGADMYQLPRFTPWDRNKRSFALRLLHNYTRSNPAVI